MIDNPPWFDDALCAGDILAANAHQYAQTDLRGAAMAQAWAVAKEWCRECDVRAACLDYALGKEAGDGHSRSGVYGGLSPDERYQEHRRRGGLAPGKSLHVRDCTVCGERFQTAGHNTMRCTDCRAEEARRASREWRRGVRARAKGVA